MLLTTILLSALACTSGPKPVPSSSCTQPPATLTANATLADAKEFFAPGGFVKIPDDLIVDAIVVANDEGGNFYRKLVLQDVTGGIEILLDRAELSRDFEIGRRVFLRTQGLYIGAYNGILQLGSAPVQDSRGGDRTGYIDSSHVPRVLLRGAFAGVPVAKVAVIYELGPADVSTLICVCDVQFVAADTAGAMADLATKTTLNRVLQDCDSGKITVRTSGLSAVGNLEVPKGRGCVTGIYGVFGRGQQIVIRTGADLDLGSERCVAASPPDAPTVDDRTILNETFGGQAEKSEVALPGWVNFNAIGNGRKWETRTFGGNAYAQLSAFKDTEAELDSWLITPALDFSKKLNVSFKSAAAFYTGDLLSVLVSTDYEGSGDPAAATWTLVTGAALPDGSLPNYTFVASGAVDLSRFTRKGHIAFRYVGSGPGGKTTTYQVDDVVVNPQ